MWIKNLGPPYLAVSGSESLTSAARVSARAVVSSQGSVGVGIGDPLLSSQDQISVHVAAHCVAAGFPQSERAIASTWAEATVRL